MHGLFTNGFGCSYQIEWENGIFPAVFLSILVWSFVIIRLFCFVLTHQMSRNITVFEQFSSSFQPMRDSLCSTIMGKQSKDSNHPGKKQAMKILFDTHLPKGIRMAFRWDDASRSYMGVNNFVNVSKIE